METYHYGKFKFDIHNNMMFSNMIFFLLFGVEMLRIVFVYRSKSHLNIVSLLFCIINIIPCDKTNRNVLKNINTKAKHRQNHLFDIISIHFELIMCSLFVILFYAALPNKLVPLFLSLSFTF